MSIFKRFFGKSKPEEQVQQEEEQLQQGLEKTKEGFFSKISKAVAGKSTVDIDFLDQLEEILI